jgi:hypothetical protein
MDMDLDTHCRLVALDLAASAAACNPNMDAAHVVKCAEEYLAFLRPMASISPSKLSVFRGGVKD